jgi:hypothetical protein
MKPAEKAAAVQNGSAKVAKEIDRWAGFTCLEMRAIYDALRVYGFECAAAKAKAAEALERDAMREIRRRADAAVAETIAKAERR